MKLLFDLHTHTVASGHAFSTLKENIEEAAQRIKSHVKHQITTVPCRDLRSLFILLIFYDQRENTGVRIFTGMEANIIDLKENWMRKKLF